jgi:hypothetical protein
VSVEVELAKIRILCTQGSLLFISLKTLMLEANTHVGSWIPCKTEVVLSQRLLFEWVDSDIITQDKLIMDLSS